MREWATVIHALRTTACSLECKLRGKLPEPVLAGYLLRCPEVIVGPVEIRTMLNQQSSNLLLSITACNMESGLSLHICCVDIGAKLQQHSSYIHVTPKGRHVQRSVA